MNQTRRVGYALAFAVTLAACGGTGPVATSSGAIVDAAVCQADLTALRASTQAVQYLSTNNAAKDLAGLLAKLDAASLKLSQGKYADAVQKLNDYASQVMILAAAGKLGDAADGSVTIQMLLDGADTAIACITAPAI